MSKTKNRPANWRDSHLPEAHCPYCDKALDGAGSPEGAIPKEGDYSICIECAQVLVFTAGLGLRKPTLVELHEAEQDPLLRKMQFLVKQLDRRKPSEIANAQSRSNQHSNHRR